ncbi:hypothetical protein IAQ61_010919 [Plenodomus lingam]|nr:hypothetical protein IAQ61_010919 [Plenodomus lingam]
MSTTHSGANTTANTSNPDLVSPSSMLLDTFRKEPACPHYNKDIIGLKPDHEDLAIHLLSDAFAVPRHNPVSSIGNSIDGDNEIADLNFMHSVLMRKGAEDAEIASLPQVDDFVDDKLPDGSLRILKEYNNAYMKHQTGILAFHLGAVNPELKLEFAYAAEATSGHHKMLSKKFEEIFLNPKCAEYTSEMMQDSQDQNHSLVLIEDLDELPLPHVEANIVPLTKADLIVRVQFSNDEHVVFVEEVSVRDDLPEDPYLFSSCEAGRKAAEALKLYQQDNEQITDKVQLDEIEHPKQETISSAAKQLKESNRHLHENSGQNDFFLAWTLVKLENLRAPNPDEFWWAYHHQPHDVDWGSGILDNRENVPARFGLEGPDILQVWREVFEKANLDPIDLFSTGLLPCEDDFGDDPEYMQAKLLWWKQKMGIDGIEAILRYHIGHVRGLRLPDTLEHFLTDEEEAWLNPIPIQRPYLYIPSAKRVFDGLHAQPVDPAKGGFVVVSWLDEVNQEELIPDNRFEQDNEQLRKLIEDSDGSLVKYDWDFCWRFAYNALMEYQDSIELYAEPHCRIENWARPMYLDEHENTSNTPAKCILAQGDLSGTVKSLHPPGLNISSSEQECNLNALMDVVVTTVPADIQMKMSALSECHNQPLVDQDRHKPTPEDSAALHAFLQRVASEPLLALSDLSTINKPKEQLVQIATQHEPTTASRLSNHEKSVLISILNNFASHNSSRLVPFDPELPSYCGGGVPLDEPDALTLRGLLPYNLGTRLDLTLFSRPRNNVENNLMAYLRP